LQRIYHPRDTCNSPSPGLTILSWDSPRFQILDFNQDLDFNNDGTHQKFAEMTF